MRAGSARAGIGHVDEVAEEALEARRGDDLDHPGAGRAGVPHRVDLAARLDDVAARAEDDLLVVRAEADLALEHDRVLVLEDVRVRRHERADLERVLDDREPPARVLAIDLEDDTDAGRESAPSAAAGLDHLDRLAAESISWIAIAVSPRRSGEQGCIVNAVEADVNIE